MSHDCCVAFPHDGMGLFAVCDCGYFLIILLTIFVIFLRVAFLHRFYCTLDYGSKHSMSPDLGPFC